MHVHPMPVKMSWTGPSGALVQVFRAWGLFVGEKLVASRGVTVERQQLDVTISRHVDEQFWRVDVHHPVGPISTRTAVDDDDNFLCHLISSAVAGEGAAWESLARVGNRHFSPPIW